MNANTSETTAAHGAGPQLAAESPPPSKTQSSWIMLPGGFTAIGRSPALEIPDGCRIASISEFSSAMYGAPFPWGFIAEPKTDRETSSLWREHRVGYGGLIHNAWFVCKEGRVGGAPNVIMTLPGALRHGTMLEGGPLLNDRLADNEGYCIARDTTLADREMFRLVQLHAMERVNADAGGIIVSPISEDGIVNVGMTGRCLWCPNRALITFPQLQKAVPGYTFELWDEYRVLSQS